VAIVFRAGENADPKKVRKDEADMELHKEESVKDEARAKRGLLRGLDDCGTVVTAAAKRSTSRATVRRSTKLWSSPAYSFFCSEL
jgi:hypothetical protein